MASPTHSRLDCLPLIKNKENTQEACLCGGEHFFNWGSSSQRTLADIKVTANQDIYVLFSFLTTHPIPPSWKSQSRHLVRIHLVYPILSTVMVSSPHHLQLEQKWELLCCFLAGYFISRWSFLIFTISLIGDTNLLLEMSSYFRQGALWQSMDPLQSL